MALVVASTVSLILVDILFAGVVLLVGFAAGWWVFASRSDSHSDSNAQSQRAMLAIDRIHDLAYRVAQDVDSHSTEVGRISSELQSLNDNQAAPFGDSAVAMIAEVLSANERLQEQLASAEEKLQAQAAEIASHQSAARTDPLTRLANRRAFNDELERRFAEWHRKSTPFSLILFDIDLFKSVNDKHGHLAGDEMLRQLGKQFANVTRQMDLACRFGGEEFAVLMPSTLIDEAISVAERMRQAIGAVDVTFASKRLQVTASVGVAQILSVDEDVSGLLRRTDSALYASKKGGRNQGHVHDGQKCRCITPGRQSSPLQESQASSPEPKSFLAGLPDQHQYRQALQRRVEEHHRYGLPLSVMFVSVDGFDQIAAEQDSHTVDVALDTVASRLQEGVREQDVLAYDSPGRFAILLPGSTHAEANQVAKRIQTLQVPHKVQLGDRSLPISLSIGLASCQSGDDADTLRLRAQKKASEGNEATTKQVQPLTV